MIEDDIRRLGDNEPDRDLDRLEADIWAGVTARVEAGKVSQVVLTCQVLTIVVALAFSIATGNRVGQTAAVHAEAQSDFTSGMRFAPSTLLLGSQS